MIHERYGSSAGFSFLEMLVAITATVIVLGTVFGLLTRSAVTNSVEMERSDLQSQARHALELLSRDVMLAGTDLPPEFPAFLANGPTVLQGGERIEILGNLRSDGSGSGPSPVVSFDGYTARLVDPPSFVAGDLVLLFDDQPTRGSWLLGVVCDVRNDPAPEIDIVTGEGATVVGPGGSVTLPMDLERYNRTLDGFPSSGFVTRISVVSYEVARDVSSPVDDPGGVLVRRVNWGESTEVAAIDSMEFRYFVGGTLSGPGYEHYREPPGSGGSTRPQRRGDEPLGYVVPQGRPSPPRPGDPGYGEDVELAAPPVPQPDADEKLDEKRVVRGVRIIVRSRSTRGNLTGSTLSRGDPADGTGYIRQTLSTRIAPRNLLNQASRREMTTETESNAARSSSNH